MEGYEDFQFSGFGRESSHPQFSTIKRHIERAVQDLFLDSLRNKSNDLLYVFNDQKQIDLFVQRILDYWEALEDYEVCKEVLELSADFKKRWEDRESLGDSSALIRIRELFKTHQ